MLSSRMLFLFGLIMVIFLLPSISHSQQPANVVIINLNEAIDPGSASMFQSALSSLSRASVSAVVIEMNTPGGYLASMQDIVDAINSTEALGIPVYTYITPDGFGASAGSYVAMSTDKIFMGPGSFIGPSTPEVVGGTALEQQHVTALHPALMVSMAQSHGRNASAAYIMVSQNIAYSAQEAYANGVVNGMYSNLSAMLSAQGLSGQQVYVNPSPYDNFLSFLSNSYVDGLLILIGSLAVLLDLYHASVVLSVVGLIMIGLGLVGVGILGGNFLGLILVVLGSVIMLFEIKTGHGIALLSGLAMGLIGAFLLSPAYISSGPLTSGVSPFSTANIITAAVIVAIGILVAFYLMQIYKGFRLKKFTGAEALIDTIAIAKSTFDHEGWVSIEGQEWKAISRNSETIEAGEKVLVVGREGLKLTVIKMKQGGP